MRTVLSGLLSMSIFLGGIAFASTEVPFKALECHSWENQRKGFSVFKSNIDPHLWTLRYYFMSSWSGTPVRVYSEFDKLKCDYKASGKEWVSYFQCMDEKGILLEFTPHLEYDETEEDFVLSKYQVVVRDRVDLYVGEEDCRTQ